MLYFSKCFQVSDARSRKKPKMFKARPKNRDFAKVFLQVEFAHAGDCRNFCKGRCNKGLDLDWSCGDLNMQHFPGISCRDDLKMLIYQGCSARMIQIIAFSGAILHAKSSTTESAPKMQLQKPPLQSHEAAGLSQGSPLSIVFKCQKIHRCESCC